MKSWKVCTLPASCSFLAASGAESASGAAAICENALSMDRVDVNTNVRDCACCESAIVHLAVGFKCDTDAMTNLSSVGCKLTLKKCQKYVIMTKTK